METVPGYKIYILIFSTEHDIPIPVKLKVFESTFLKFHKTASPSKLIPETKNLTLKSKHFPTTLDLDARIMLCLLTVNEFLLISLLLNNIFYIISKQMTVNVPFALTTLKTLL